MSRLFRKFVIFLVFLIAVLQVIHITLMSRLEKKNRTVEKPNKMTIAHFVEKKYHKRNVIEEREEMYRSLQSLNSVLDSSGEYRILSFLLPSDALKVGINGKRSNQNKFGTTNSDGLGSDLIQYRRNDIAVVTHGSILQLHHLDLLAQRWHGLISVAVFVFTIQQLPLVIETILLLRYCNPAIRHRVSFHLVYPLSIANAKLSNRQAQSVLDFLKWPDLLDSYPELDQFVDARSCAIQAAVEKLVERTPNYHHKVPYPNNLLRNTARRHAMTEYSLIIDADLVPSAQLYEQFHEFGKRTKLFKEWDALIESNNLPENKVVFVLPTYEIDLNQSHRMLKDANGIVNKDYLIPRTKNELILAIEQRTVRPFYIELCWKCQKYTDYQSWLHSSNLINTTNDDQIDILFEVLWHDPWEPFYISSNNVPLYDERFRQYGFNRISQVCELHMAGYKFSVLNNAFLVHKGFKTPNDFHVNKDSELEHNRVLFRQFKLQLKDRYATSRRC